VKHFDSITQEDQDAFYRLLNKQVEALIEGERDMTANLANVSALLGEQLTDINWVGFYLVKEGELVLGPFQGKVACVRIKIGQGVCGSAVAEEKIQVVEDVHLFKGHIACDSASRSEIVVPIRAGGKIVGVLDIDSPLLARFNEKDADYLQACVHILEDGCIWENI
jgi:GAF domain-containing protein